jgi:hypothetical protein
MEKTFALGAIPSPADSRDWHIERLIPKMTALPDEFCHAGTVIKNQGNVGSCVAESLALCREIKEFQQEPDGNYRKYSEEWIYGNRGLDDYQYKDEFGSIWADVLGVGMIPRIAIGRLKQYGVPAKEDVPSLRLVEWPEAQNQVRYIYTGALPLAYPHRITAYARLYTAEEIKQAVYNIGPVTIMISCWNWWIDGNNILHPNDDPVTGYHEVTIVGWRKDNTFIVANSWGEEWGDKGFCYIPFDYPIIEAWSMTDEIVPYVEPKPAPTPTLWQRIKDILRGAWYRLRGLI